MNPERIKEKLTTITTDRLAMKYPYFLFGKKEWNLWSCSTKGFMNLIFINYVYSY